MGWLDWVVVAWVLAVVFGVGLTFRRRASRSFGDFFLSGRSLPWWLLGISMVATTFASDTPLWVTGQVRQHGIVANWFWWNFLVGTTLTVFFYAKLWRRAGFATDVEFVSLRYGGAAGGLLRGFRSIYMAFVFNGIILGWVMKAMTKVLEASLGLEADSVWLTENYLLYVLIALALVYTVSSGLWGVVATDLIQFVLAMLGSISLAVLAWNDIGGAAGMRGALTERFGGERAGDLLAFLPDTVGGWGGLSATLAIFYFTAQWWAVIYPGGEPGGGSYVAQRMLAARSERDARAGTLVYAIAHYALRSWPWIVVALWAAARYDPTGDLEIGYARAMTDLLPAGLLGLLVASFFAAFMSTVDTQLTLAGSYVVNDFYRPFLVRNASERHYVAVSRVAIVLVLAVGAFIGSQAEDIGTLWSILVAIGAGSGLVLLLRWYWWRVNAFSELAAMVTSLVIAFLTTPDLRALLPLSVQESLQTAIADDGVRLFVITGGSTAGWLLVTFLTPAVRPERLRRFYEKVRPGGFWGPVARDCPHVHVAATARQSFVSWVLASVMIYGILFAIGKWIFDDLVAAAVLGGVAFVAGMLLWGNEEETRFSQPGGTADE